MQGSSVAKNATAQSPGLQSPANSEDRLRPGDTSICCTLWLAQWRRMTALLAKQLRQSRLTLGEYELLTALQDGPQAQADICQRTEHSGASVSRWLDYLEAEGWVQRERAPCDRRRCLVRLTEAGSQRLDSARRSLSTLTADINADLGPAEKRSLVRVYRSMERVLSAGGMLE